ncbi:copper chaperone PCu(A)C [Guyparkeria sp.]|uniref:copper chaperone PCu(A)C n=1 Tax=Guyparkeria sp. TaxID=2035736 RepID=UPI003562A159
MTQFAVGRFTGLLLGAALLASAGAAQAAELDVQSPWVALAPPGAHATAAFMKLHNPGDEAIDVVSADADGFKKVELHLSVNEDGMHRMIEQERITVPAGETVLLAPGGYHVMLIGPERSLDEGEVVAIELGLGDGDRITVEAPVTPRDKAMGGHGHMH